MTSFSANVNMSALNRLPLPMWDCLVSVCEKKSFLQFSAVIVFRAAEEARRLCKLLASPLVARLQPYGWIYAASRPLQLKIYPYMLGRRRSGVFCWGWGLKMYMACKEAIFVDTREYTDWSIRTPLAGIKLITKVPNARL